MARRARKAEPARDHLLSVGSRWAPVARLLPFPHGRHDTGPLPRDVVRDLLGICRAQYAARRADGAPAEELAELEQAGRKLALALEMSKTLPDTLGHRAAWSWARQGLDHLSSALAAGDDSLRALVSATAGRLTRTG